ETLQKLRQRFTDDWLIIDGEDEKIRDQQFAQSILEAMQRLPVHQDNGAANWKQAAVPQLLLEPQNEELAEN
ncbi:hypothetical protein, partial [Alistipes finegoldii]